MNTKYDNLPDYMDPEDLKKYFDELMDMANNPYAHYDFVIMGLYQLAERQWHTYTLLEEKVKNRVEEFISKILLSRIWENKPTGFLIMTLVIIGNLGLSTSYELLKEITEREPPTSYKKEMQRIIDEVDRGKKGQVNDPWAEGPK
jgi:hypothetical protein